MTKNTPTMSEDATTKAPYSDRHLAALETEVRWVTPQEARELRDSCRFERQREIRSDHVHRLADEMKQGWFLAGTPIWFCVLPDRSMVLVNGNHTLEAVAECGAAIPLTLVYQQVGSIDEAAQAYACFDIQRTRTWGQAAHAAGIDAGLPETGKTIAAVGIIQSGFSTASHLVGVGMLSRPTRFGLLAEYRGAALLIHAAMTGSPPINQRLVRRAAVFAIALATARYQPATAEEFWGGLALDDGLRVTDPRKALLRYLQNNSANPNMGSRRNQAAAAANAWNAFFEKRSIEVVKTSGTFELLGTPWTRKGAMGLVKIARHKSPLAIGRQMNGRGDNQVITVYSE